jgi:hypothetical protein
MDKSMRIAVWIWDKLELDDFAVWQGMWLSEAADEIEELIQSIEDKT